MGAERALVDVDARDAVTCVALDTRAVIRARKVGAARLRVAVVGAGGALVDLEARVGLVRVRVGARLGVRVRVRARVSVQVGVRVGVRVGVAVTVGVRAGARVRVGVRAGVRVRVGARVTVAV